MYCSPLACCVLFTLACCVLFTLACCVLFTLACCVLFTFSSFVFCMFIFKPVFSASCINLFDFFDNCLSVCDSRQISSAKSRSSNCLVNVRWMPFWPCLTGKKVKSSPRHYTLGSHEGLYGQCLNLVSVVRSNLECSYTDSPGRDTSPSQVPSKQCLYSFAAE